MQHQLLLAAIVLALAACAAPDPGTPSAPPEPPTAAPTAAPAPPFFELVFDQPVFRHGGEGSWFAGAVEPGAVIALDGRFHLFFNGFDGWPSRSAVGHAVSDDGRRWTLLSKTPLLASGDGGFDGFSFFVSSVIQLQDETLVMYLYTLDEPRDGAPGHILAATATAAGGPWTLRPDPVLLPGAPGAWDASRVTQPHVLRVGEAYRMYFAGYEDDRLQGARNIGLAFSEDGLRWVKSPDPVLRISETLGAWDSYRVFQPRVVPVEDGFLMLYKANVSVGRAEAWGLAASADGITWDRSAGNPLIDEHTYGIELRRNGIAELFRLGDELVLLLEILEREGGGYHHGNSAYRSNLYLLTHSGLP